MKKKEKEQKKAHKKFEKEQHDGHLLQRRILMMMTPLTTSRRWARSRTKISSVKDPNQRRLLMEANDLKQRKNQNILVSKRGLRETMPKARMIKRRKEKQRFSTQREWVLVLRKEVVKISCEELNPEK